MPTLQGRGIYGYSRKSISSTWRSLEVALHRVDYMLTRSGIRCIWSRPLSAALPALHPATTSTSPFFWFAYSMLLNLRGLKESASSLMIPVNLYHQYFVFLFALWNLSASYRFSRYQSLHLWACCTEPALSFSF